MWAMKGQGVAASRFHFKGDRPFKWQQRNNIYSATFCNLLVIKYPHLNSAFKGTFNEDGLEAVYGETRGGERIQNTRAKPISPGLRDEMLYRAWLLANIAPQMSRVLGLLPINRKRSIYAITNYAAAFASIWAERRTITRSVDGRIFERNNNASNGLQRQ
jgi:hypothetical protein